ncbi:MAG: hypothetical protein EBT48_00520 [Verrucomicrobia bacterium]|nr:hypothetical protein [Verrucomicrobiota bacterium]
MKVSLVAGTKVAIGVEVKMGGIFDERDGGDAPAVLKTRGEGFGESCLGGAVQGDAILDNGDKEILLWRSLRKSKGEGFEAGGFIEALGFAVKEDSAKALAGEEGGRFVGGGFLWKGDTEKEPGFLVGVVGEEVGKDGVGSPRLDGLRAVGTGEFSETGEDEFEVIGDFGDSADGAAGGADGVALAKGDGGGDTLDSANAWAVHTLEELAGVGAEGFGVTALAFGVEGIESKGGLARAGGTGQDMKHTEGKIEGEIFQIILAGTFDADKTG